MGKKLFVSISALVVVLCIFIEPSSAFMRKLYNPSSELANVLLEEQFTSADDNDVLFLTPYIEAGKLAEGRNLSEVINLPGGVPKTTKSFSGYLTVNKTFNSNIFFWFFPPLSGKVDKDTPVMLWLQGGPGASSLYGLFVENGPLQVSKDLNIFQRNHTWNKDYAILYFDQPVGTGFSFTDNDEGYAKNEVDVARDMYEALKQFFTLYEDFRGNPFYVAGESYGGKYVPAITYKIHKEGDAAKSVGINLQGMLVGDGLCDPRNMHDYGDYLYQVGLIDELQREHFYREQTKLQHLIEERKFEAAFRVFDALLNGDLTPGGTSYYRNVTGITNYFNILFDSEPAETGYYNNYLALKTVRTAIHVGSRPYNDGSEVEKHLINDIMDSVKPWVEEILNAEIRSLFYSGQLDVIVAAPLTENFLKKLSWRRSSAFNHSPRMIYKVAPEDASVAGYVRQAGNQLYYAIVRKAGHMVPYDQPRVALDMVTRFVTQKDFV